MNTLHIELPRLRAFLAEHSSLVVLSGAGVSASSGIPTYRDRQGVWRHADPVTHQEFVDDPARRQRYWARSMRGWPAVRDARPNAAHLSLARLERMGHISLLITQNVDRLHQRAGSNAVVDLHGRVDQVRCMQCAEIFARENIQHAMERDNPAQGATQHDTRPDGDADIADEQVLRFRTPACPRCKGILIPDVVFFGGSVPATRVKRCKDAIADADALLVVGSSLQVYSGFRFCRLAKQLGKPLAILNPGTTRADALASLKCLTECEVLLPALAASNQEPAHP
jgi:NAD-dependent SIR2 family protein deacetylase